MDYCTFVAWNPQEKVQFKPIGKFNQNHKLNFAIFLHFLHFDFIFALRNKVKKRK